jgi:hypothetical protein
MKQTKLQLELSHLMVPLSLVPDTMGPQAPIVIVWAVAVELNVISPGVEATVAMGHTASSQGGKRDKVKSACL